MCKMKRIVKNGFVISIESRYIFEGRNEVYISVRKVGVKEGIGVIEDIDVIRKVGIKEYVKRLIAEKFGLSPRALSPSFIKFFNQRFHRLGGD